MHHVWPTAPARAGALGHKGCRNGETGYAFRSDLRAAKLVLLGATADAVESSGADGRVPIYRADGVTVLGYLDPAGSTR